MDETDCVNCDEWPIQRLEIEIGNEGETTKERGNTVEWECAAESLDEQKSKKKQRDQQKREGTGCGRDFTTLSSSLFCLLCLCVCLGHVGPRLIL